MQDSPSNCVFCQRQIASEAIILWRPFGCPDCRQLIAVRHRYGWFQGIGCLTILLACSANLVFMFNLSWLLSLVAGLILGVALSTLARKLLLRFWPGPPSFSAYIVRDCPEALKSVLALAQDVAKVEVWTDEHNSQLNLVRSQISLDEALEDSALELIAFLKSTLQGVPFRGIKGLPRDLTPDALRRELRLISVDLRQALGP